VRELENAIERAVLVAKSAEVQPQDLPDSIRGDAVAEDAFTVPPHHTLAEIERMAVVQTLQRTTGTSRRRRRSLVSIGRRCTARSRSTTSRIRASRRA
jgi:DNA-binding NtrC family response regulator